MESNAPARSPSALIYISVVPFVIFTASLLFINNEYFLSYITFLLAAYALILNSYIGGLGWGIASARHARDQDLEPMKRPILECWGPVILSWLAMTVHDVMLTLVLLCFIQIIQLFIYYGRLRKRNYFPEHLIPLKLHPFYVSIPSLLFAALIFLYKQ